MPSAQDHVNVKPGGLGEAVLGDRLQIFEFPDMRHGWTTREDSYMTSTEEGYLRNRNGRDPSKGGCVNLRAS